MRVSVLYPVMPADPRPVVPFAALVRDGWAARLWQGQSLSADTQQVFAYLAGMGYRVPVGTGVALMPLRHPLDAAIQARSLAVLTGHRTVLGLGPATPDFVAGLHGKPYDSPRDACEHYLTEVRRLIGTEDGVAAAHGGATVGLPGLPHPGVETGLGVLRPTLARAAGRVADAAISWMTPPGYVRDTLLPAMAKGAAEAGRPVPRVVTVVHAAVDRPGRNAYRLAYTAAHVHLAGPHYADNCAAPACASTTVGRASAPAPWSTPASSSTARPSTSPRDWPNTAGREWTKLSSTSRACIPSMAGRTPCETSRRSSRPAARRRTDPRPGARAGLPDGRPAGTQEGEAPRCPTTSPAG
jgi:alkanesulfonate monooxygenase SsuD/methylene tetrahydromethanopterin reductase-like flavin-dependent oxidoreductase (luciferase family)